MPGSSRQKQSLMKFEDINVVNHVKSGERRKLTQEEVGKKGKREEVEQSCSLKA